MSIAKAISRSAFDTYRKLSTLEKNSFRYWRVRILYSSIIGYAAYYLVRQNFPIAMTGFMADFGYTKTETGWIATAFSVVYGIGKFVNGYFSDRSNARYFIAAGLFFSGIVNIFVGFAEGIYTLGLLWMLNGCFQSMGWPPCARLMTHWFSPKELGTKWALWASSHQIGGATILALAGFLVDNYTWRWAFWVPSFFAIILSFFLIDRLRDTPEKVGLPPVEEYKGDVICQDSAEKGRVSFREIIPIVLSNPRIWWVSFANLFLYIPRMGVFFWAPTFLKEHKGMSLSLAGLQMAGFEVCGLFGGIIAGWLSDRVFDGRRGPVGALFLVGLAGAMALLWMIPRGYPALNAGILGIAGFLVYGPQVLAGVATADFSSKRAVGVATGFSGSFAYAGSGIAGVGVGYMADLYGWDGPFILFIISSLLGALCFAAVWRYRSKILDQRPTEEEYP